MKLALFISSLGSGGAERVLSDLANHWAKAGHEVHLITFASENEVPFYPLDKNIRLHPLDLLDETSSIFKRGINIINRLIVIRKTVKRLNPDRILSFIEITNITVLMATLGLNIPVVVSERTDPNFHRIPDFYSRLRLWLYRFSKKTIVQTKSAQSFFSYQDNIQIIPNAASTSRYQAIYRVSVLSIVSVGRLIRSKAFDLLIRSFSNIADDFPNATLTIYGEGPERQNLEDLIRHLNLENRVFLPGAVKNIQEKLAEADLFVFPSRFEGFPNALCEAMAVGLPVIASNCSGNVDVVEDGVNGVLFPVGDEAALIKQIKSLCCDPKLREKLGRKALEISDTYSPEKIYRLWDETVIKLTESNKF